MVNDVKGISNSGLYPSTPDKASGIGLGVGPSFQDVLKEKVGVDKPDVSPPLKFSTHAVERMSTRGITLQPGDVKRLEDAVQKAGNKGAKETLLLMGDNAFIVNVKNKTVVTAMDRNLMKENVFTNIDSTIVL